MTRQDLQILIDALAPVLRQALAEKTAALDARVLALETKAAMLTRSADPVGEPLRLQLADADLTEAPAILLPPVGSRPS